MDDPFTRISIWAALIAYAATVVLISRHKFEYAKWAWGLGCLFFLTHVVFAFQIHYQWSHDVAVAKTAQQTKEVTNITTDSGIYVNYMFSLVWIIDTAWWYCAGSDRYMNRRKSISSLLHLFFVFMIFNGAVVFAQGPARGIGIAVLLVVAGSWFARKTENTNNRGSS